jgi:hypothetical protein
VYHLRNLSKFSFQNLLKTSRKFELNQSKGKSICLAAQSCNYLCQGESYKSHIAKIDDGFLNSNMLNSRDNIYLYITSCRALHSSNS